MGGMLAVLFTFPARSFVTRHFCVVLYIVLEHALSGFICQSHFSPLWYTVSVQIRILYAASGRSVGVVFHVATFA